MNTDLEIAQRKVISLHEEYAQIQKEIISHQRETIEAQSKTIARLRKGLENLGVKFRD